MAEWQTYKEKEGHREKEKKKQASFQVFKRLPTALGQMVMSPKGCFVSEATQVAVKTAKTRQSWII